MLYSFVIILMKITTVNVMKYSAWWRLKKVKKNKQKKIFLARVIWNYCRWHFLRLDFKKQQVAVDLASQALSSHYTITPIDSILPLTQRVRWHWSTPTEPLKTNTKKSRCWKQSMGFEWDHTMIAHKAGVKCWPLYRVPLRCPVIKQTVYRRKSCL